MTDGLSVPMRATLDEAARFIWRAMRSRYRDHAAELTTIRRHIDPEGIACDVGANKGSFLFWLSRWAGQVVAFEPQQELASYLLRVCSATGLRNVKVESKAVYSSSGESVLFIPHGHQPGASLVRESMPTERIDTVSVPMVSLDDYFGPQQRISVIKIDVEGAEVAVFKGAERILRHSRPLLVFECEGRNLQGCTMQDVFAYLAAFGYEGSFINRGRVCPLASFREGVHQRRTGKWFWKRADYCPNFIFTPQFGSTK